MDFEADDVVEQRMAAWDVEVRAKYTAEQLEEMGKKGEAFKNPDGSYSYPIGDADDLTSAIKAVGRGNADHDAIRKYIIGRAKVLDKSAEIPDNWASDGSLKQANALPKSVEWRQKRAAELRGSERRTHLEQVEFRDNPDGSLHLTGYASLTETPYDMGWYSESISRGAFTKTLGEQPDVQLLVNHAGLPLARTKSGTLQLSEDSRGLKVDADLDPEDPDVQSLARKMKRGDIDQMSFAFTATRQSWNEDYTQRSIAEANLHRGDVSVVNQGASPTTFASIRSDDAIMTFRHLGAEGIAEGLWGWLRYRCLPSNEARAGATISSATMDVLTQVLNLSAIADDAVDQQQVILAALMGVENPDDLDAYGQARDDTACPSCGEMNDSDAQHCDQCGSAMTTPDAPAADDDSAARSAALILEARRLLEQHRYPPRKSA